MVAKTADKTDPALWDKVKQRVTQEDKGGRAGEWSARKAQLAVSEYKKAGGGYRGRKAADNTLVKWQREDWGTKSSAESLKSGERYLPKAARQSLTAEEYKHTTAKKRADTKHGAQFSQQPKDVAKKTAAARKSGTADTTTRKALMAEAAHKKIPGRSRMSKAELAHALGQAS